MRSLAVKAFPKEGNLVPVMWRLDQSAWHGCVKVQVEEQQQDAEIVAELCALHFLMGVRSVFGSGNGIYSGNSITVSFGAIKRLTQQDTEKGHLVPFGRFLFFALDGGNVDVSKDAAWVEATDLRESEEAQVVAAPIPFPSINVDGLGELFVTRHAAERYIERNILSESIKAGEIAADAQPEYKGRVKAAMAGIRRQLAHKETVRSDQKASVRTIARHGKEAVELIHQPSKTVFVIVEDAGRWVLSTVKKESPGQKLQPVYVRGRIEMRRSD